MADDRQALAYPAVDMETIDTSCDRGASSCQKATQRPQSPVPRQRVKGLRQAALIVSLLMGLLFSSLDTSIVATSLVTVSHDLQDFVNAPWIVLAYLLTYMGCAVCISKLSDIYGRRNMLVISWVVFIGFSLGCGTSEDMIALIICRAFQGVGASGMYSLTQIGLVEVGPAHRPSLIGAMIGSTLAIAFVLGPLIGGAVAHLSDWRWLFNMNIPFGLVTILAIGSLWPQEEAASFLSWAAFTRIDFVGGATLLCSSGLLVFAVQQAGSQTYAWGSPPIVSALVFSGLSWVAFIFWELRLDVKRHHVEPVFPIRLALSRVYSASLLTTLLTGFSYIALTIVIPERLQIVNGESVLMAGVHILPLLGACAIGSFLGGAISSKRNNTAITLVAASCLQLLGLGLMILISSISSNPPSQYGFQAIFGLGVGLSFSAATIMTNILAAEAKHRASAQGAVAQARVFGGCIGLSICTVIFNAHANRSLDDHLNDDQIQDLHRTPLAALRLPDDKQDLVKSVYSHAFKEEIKVMVLVSAAMVVVSLLTLERHPAPLERFAVAPKDDTSQRRYSDSATELNEITSVRQGI